MEFSQVLADNTNIIIAKWVVAVREDRQIESADDLSYTAIKNHIPDVFKAMVTVLSQSQESDIKSIVTASWQHGLLRAEQGFDPSEIAREYRLLRKVVFDTIEVDLLQRTPGEIIRSMRLIDAVIDEAIARCFHSYVGERLRELEHLQSSLTLHNEELTRLVTSNEDKLSQLAHELKHPLTAIIGYSDLFLRQQRREITRIDNTVNIEHIERVLRNGRHLLRLINNVLELSRYEAGKIQLQPAPIHIRDLINNVCEMLEPLAAEKNLAILVNWVQAPSEIITDGFQLQQIITNLVSNAIRYTESGNISIVCEAIDDQKWAIAVSDTGIGIAEKDQTKIFEPYFRVSSKDRPYLPDSTGLGLAIVSRLVKLLQGEINLVSKEGLGSTFTVTLPLKVKT
ncbi:sensor histidine kinase [Anabaena sp. FACHB-709]|uniref:histidine kinase n=2 Tax=Nostocaceae TaxID=1162 RepID=A0A1Z4KI72_ANAVA|nr:MULTISPECIES: sensor histidine kinase [Nostocaceae]BAY68662.1 two-component sensor histidine kinase [Trichormus variabilis NIES-23]HBW28935.1 sensor histidine kinase [Nostoc sp. UBA8866]MBD2170244.1 sensor histidine kinase [Anabaena cylindrica FACHB-318]MBD2262276.1 sensor histidine kinase [Anabaena sp. FACHB-709]MBD2281865.1 sensor histidine kinase [Anabaena cylindrica FACHB-170]